MHEIEYFSLIVSTRKSHYFVHYFLNFHDADSPDLWLACFVSKNHYISAKVFLTLSAHSLTYFLIVLNVTGKEHALVVCNHKSDIDWLVGWVLAQASF